MNVDAVAGVQFETPSRTGGAANVVPLADRRASVTATTAAIAERVTPKRNTAVRRAPLMPTPDSACPWDAITARRADRRSPTLDSVGS